jgi:hypothetical protein
MWKFLKQYFMPEYTSPLDQFLQDYGKTCPQPSESQRKEKEIVVLLAKLLRNRRGLA